MVVSLEGCIKSQSIRKQCNLPSIVQQKGREKDTGLGESASPVEISRTGGRIGIDEQDISRRWGHYCPRAV